MNKNKEIRNQNSDVRSYWIVVLNEKKARSLSSIYGNEMKLFIPSFFIITVGYLLNCSSYLFDVDDDGINNGQSLSNGTNGYAKKSRSIENSRIMLEDITNGSLLTRH